MKESDYERLNDAKIEKDGVKIVGGPGTGHGQGFLIKSKFSPCYDIYPSEGGHKEFSPRNETEYELMQFAHKYIKSSDNVENRQFKGEELYRIS